MITRQEVKFLQALSDKKQRDAEGLFLAEGPKILEELLRDHRQSIVKLYATPQWFEDDQSTQIEAAVITESELERISSLKTPNRVLALVRKPVYDVAADINVGFTLALDGIQDPGNLGTIIRTADWFGITQIICSNDTADAFSPKVVQSTMGSVLRVKLMYTNLLEWLEQTDNTPVYAATLEGESVYDVTFEKNGILIIGSEGKGIRPEIAAKATQRVAIPAIGKAESLNAAVATGILLSHMLHV